MPGYSHPGQHSTEGYIAELLRHQAATVTALVSTSGADETEAHDEFTVASTPATTYQLTYIPSRIQVLTLRGRPITEGTHWTCDYSTGIVTIQPGVTMLASPPPADVITVRYVVTDDLAAQSIAADSGYPSAVLADSPWGYWRQQESSGTTLADASPNAHALSIPGGAPTFGQTGPESKAILWPDSSGATEYYAQSTATTSATTVTLEAWVYLTAVPTALTPILSIGAGYNTDPYYSVMFVDTAGKLGSISYSGTGQSDWRSTAAMSLNTWHYCVVSIGGSGAPSGSGLYVDAVQQLSAGSTISTPGGSGRVVMLHGGGLRASVADFRNGNALLIAEPAYYETALTATQVSNHYAAR